MSALSGFCPHHYHSWNNPVPVPVWVRAARMADGANTVVGTDKHRVYFVHSRAHGYEPRHTGGRLTLCSVPGRPISTRTLSMRLLPVRLALGLRLAAARPLRLLVDPLDAKGRREARAQPGPHAGAAPRLDTPPPAHPAGARRRLQHRRRGLALQVGVRAWLD